MYKLQWITDLNLVESGSLIFLHHDDLGWEPVMVTGTNKFRRFGSSTDFKVGMRHKQFCIVPKPREMW